MLSEEEKKAIEKLNRLTVCEIQKGNIGIPVMIKDLEIVLNLITKLQKENEEKDNLINEIDKDIEKNIYLAESNYNIEELNNYARGMYDTYINMRKQYFEKLAKEKKERARD